MKNPPIKVINLIALVFVLIFNINCSKDSDLFLDSVLNDPDSDLVENRDATLPTTDVNEGFELRTYTFSAINDAFLQEEKGYDQSIVRLQEDLRTSFLMFDLSPVNGEITDAVLQLYIDSDEGDGTISVHKGASSDWIEEDLSSVTAPQIETQLGNVNKAYKIGNLEKVPLTISELQTEKTTLVLTHSQGNDLAFASKENTNNKGPKLVVTYKVAEGTAAIEVPEEENNTPQPTTPSPTPTPSPAPVDNQPNVDGYYVTVNGKSTNDGLSEATAWSIEHAFSIAKAGDVVYIKAGNYGAVELIADNSGTSNNPIKFIGYTNTPADISSNTQSTFRYGDNLDSSKMPLLSGNTTFSDIGLYIQENYIEITNLQIRNFLSGIISTGHHVKIKNIVLADLGEQNNNSLQNGKGIQIHGDNTTVSNSFILNSNSEGINIKGGNNCVVKNTNVYSDNIKNPTGYYIIISGNGKNNIIENCIAFRDPDANLHQGHGIIIKDKGSENIIRGCTTYNTGFEVNFSGVTNNTFENSKIFGRFSEYPNQFSCIISVMNGAHHNTFKDIYIEDTRYAIKFHDFDDGFKASDGDRDMQEGGHFNKFINIEVNKAQNAIAATSPDVGARAFSENNEFISCKFKNITSVPFFSYQTIRNTKIIDCSFEDIPYSKMVSLLSGGSFQLTFENCTFTNVGFSEPN